MNHMEIVGLKISELRKKNNMTQIELAEKMNISFQAVSNWERGVSMPDISKLPELAKLFEVSIGEILGEESDLLSASDRESCKEDLSQAKQISFLREAENILPLVGSEVVDQLARKAFEEGNYTDLGIAAPFTSGSQLKKIAEEEYEKNGLQNFELIAPFLNSTYLNELAKKELQENGIKAIEPIAPLIDKKILTKYMTEQYLK